MGTTSKSIGELLPIILLAITVAWYFQYQENATRQIQYANDRGDCFPVDVSWIQQERDYGRNPTIWDCSKDILEDPIPSQLVITSLQLPFHRLEILNSGNFSPM
jgi:hypothetical protein